MNFFQFFSKKIMAYVEYPDINSSGLKKLNEEIWKKILKEQVILPIGEINQGTENRYTEV